MTSEKKRQAARRHYAKNREQLVEKARLYRETNPEKYREILRRYREANREKLRAQERLWAKANPEKRRAIEWRSQGIDPVAAARLLAEHDGHCAICRTTEPIGGWHIDHDHATGHVRGVLCGNCNKGLGFFKDSSLNLSRAHGYLKGFH